MNVPVVAEAVWKCGGESSTIKSDLFVWQFKIKNTKCKYSKFIFRQALVKGIESPYRPFTGHECCRRFRLPDFETLDTRRGKFVSPTHRPHLPPRKYSWHLFLLESVSNPGS